MLQWASCRTGFLRVFRIARSMAPITWGGYLFAGMMMGSLAWDGGASGAWNGVTTGSRTVASRTKDTWMNFPADSPECDHWSTRGSMRPLGTWTPRYSFLSRASHGFTANRYFFIIIKGSVKWRRAGSIRVW